MSEIRSISEGTFVIGDTNGLTFEAGPGITVSQPSEGTVRIANDETVLWEGSAYDSINLSEDPTHFEQIKMFYSATSGPSDRGAGSFSFDPSKTDRIILENNFLYQITSNSFSDLNIAYLALKNVNTTSWSKIWGGFRNVNSTGSLNSNLSFLIINKVVGINRISGGNNE